MLLSEKIINKSTLKISKICEMDSASVTKETIGLSRWINKQNARDLKELSD